MNILIHATLLFLYLTTFSGYAQSPQFLQNLSADNGNVCYGANVTYSTTVVNATHYAFQLQNSENGNWSKVSEGSITTASNNLEYTIYGLSASPTVRVLIVNGSDSVYSNQHSVNVQRPLFSFHPSDLVQCNGEDAIFRVSSPNGSVFQWQGSTDGGASFTDLLVTAKFKNVTTPDLTVTGIVNGHNGQAFRCKVTDAFGCEGFSDTGILRVNRLSSAISPTLSTQFCEGDTSRFFPQEIIGDTVSTQWQLRRAGESSYSNLQENAKFAGVNSSTLTVKGILPAENSYRVRIGFKNALQNSSGQIDSSVCYLQSVRANYVINSRPDKPSVLDTVSKCGPSYFNFLGSQPYNWYADTLSSPLAANSATFQTQEIAETTPYYFSWKDTKGCESHKQQIVAQVHSVPSQSFGEFEAICPTTDSLSVNFSSVLENPQTIYIRSSDLSGFGSVAIPIAQAKALLPGNKNSGVYNVELFTKNEHCFSDTVNRSLTVLKSTVITNHPSDAGVCLGETLTLNADYQADLPVSFIWQKDNVVLTNQNEIPLRITSVVNEDAGNYRLIINGACGSDTSALAIVAVSPAIDILQQPTNASACIGSNLVYKVKATGSSDLHYQWFINEIEVGNNADSLILENVSAAVNNAKIKCRIESNCSQPTFTNEVTLLVNSLPLGPVISDTVRFCTSSETAELVLDIQDGYTANWYNELQQKLDNSRININQAEGKTYFVSQTDDNGCESSLTPFVIDSAPSFSISIIANTTKLCHSGNFNTSGSLVAYPSQSSTIETNYGLQLNGNPIAANTSGNFDFTSPGHYVVTAARGFCTSTDSLRISSVAEDLVSSPVTQDLEVCSGESITLTLDSDYENGNYFWWLDQQDNSGLFMGKDFLVGNIARDTTFFVSYGRETDGVFCESPRAELKVELKGELSVSIETISGDNCTENASVQIRAAGQSPFSYTLNDSLTNTSGAFFSLATGMHFLNVTDAAGCSKDTTFIIQNASGPQIVSNPNDVRVCSGNIANFTFAANNYDSIVWFKKLPSEEAFTAISGENTLNLRITNSGNALNSHQTKYKAVISKGECQVSTSEVTLLVNSISGSNPSKTVCENDSTSLNLESYNITGNVLSYQWQYRAGTTGVFENMENQTSATIGLQLVRSQHAGYYRNRVVFDNGNGNTCVINTSTGGMRLIVNSLPRPILIGADTICSGQSATLTVQNCNGTATWSDGKVAVQNIVFPTETTSYRATCSQSGCVNNSDSVTVVVRSGSISKPIISANKPAFCYGDSVVIQATNCEGTIQWSSGETGNSLEFLAETNTQFSAICFTEECQSPSSDTLQITVSPQLLPGSITENTGIYCAGYNPPNITSAANPNISNIQWQVSQDCAVWQNIEGATSMAYNPPAIQSTTCYRRMVWNSCDTLFSNTVTIEIVPDPVITIESDKETVCADEPVTLTSELISGTGNCTVQWQINKVSAAVSNPNWRDLSTGEILNYSLANTTSDSTFHFRSRITCDGNSCNIATSNVQSILFKATPILTSNLSDTTVCAGSIVTFTANCKNGDLLWSDGSTNSQISIQSAETRNLSVSCGSSCFALKDSVTITVISGIEKPIIVADKAAFCYGDSVVIQAGNCEGTIQWSNGEIGVNLNLIAENNFSISAICITEECQSPASDTLQITVFSQLLPGSITENAGIYCAGYNPPNITSAANPNTSNIQWQISQDCAVWQNIEGATSATYNPPVIQSTTCYRRMVWNTCDTLYSNTVTVEIVPDPTITIESDKETVCSNEPVTLTSELIGGTGNCIMQWQINKVSVAVSNPNWRDLSTGETLNYSLNNPVSDSTFHFRSRVTCDGNSCNIATSNVQSTLFKAAPILISNLTDTTVCAGSTLTFTANCKNGDLLWSDGSTGSLLLLKPLNDSEISVRCSNDCSESVKLININVTEGISPPTSITTDSIFSPASLVFKAEGLNLKWYTSESASVPLDSSPVVHLPGNYTFWVSQTIGDCESPRLRVSASLLANIRIISQTNEMVNCYGNVSNLIVSASGSGTLQYKWQRKLPDENVFSDVVASSFMSRENTASLRVGSTGNAESPTGTLFRCVVSDDFGQFTSAEIPITANRIQGSLPNRNLCIGETLALNLANSHTITGTPLSIQWQHRRGTGDTWTALADTGNVSGSNTLQLRISNLTELDQIQFRCSITFSSNAGSCIETSDLMTLKVGQFPEVPENIEQEICQGERLQRFVITPPAGHKVTWYRFNDETPLRTQPTVNTTISGNHLIQYVIESNLGCKSPKALIKVTVNPTPNLPVNTTPAVYDESESLTFSAVGENLKWYRTKTLKPYEDYPPTFNSIIGRKSYYVTQTDEKGCESERLQIQSQMLAVFGISTQPVSRSNCDGNTVTFGVRTRGGTNISYQWQVDHQGVFIDLPGEIARDLRIADTGVSPFVDGSVYRCIVSSGDKKIISNTVELKVNYLRAVLPEINLCDGEKLSFERYADSLSGIINKIEWQRRIGSSYSTVYESSNLSDFFVPDSNSSGSYRFRVTFHNLGGGSCVRNSNVIRFNQHTLPAMVGLDSLTFCEGESVQSLVAKLPPLSNLLHLDSTKVDLHSAIHQNSSFIVNTSNSFGCSSPYKTFKPIALPIPKLGNIDSVKAICRFSKFTDHKIQNLNTRWYLSENTNVYTENRLLLETHEAGIRDIYYKVKGENGCESEKYKMRVEVSSCYFEGDVDTCLTTEYSSVERNEWTYFYKENGEIYGAIHPSGSNMGRVEMHVTSTVDSVFEDLSKNHFYPRSWTVNTSRSLISPYKVRLYLSEGEIAQFTKTVRDSVTVLRKNSVTPNCDWQKDSTLMWMIGHGVWLDTDNDKYYFVEFETDKTGQFLLWSDLIPAGNLNVVLNQNQVPELSIENYKVLPIGNYVVNKSEKGIEWNELKSGIANQESFTDMRPYLYNTQYQLLYDFQNGIIALLDTKEINISETFSQCILFENPATDNKRIAVYFPEVDKNKILLSDILGREVPLKQVVQSSDRFEINPLNPLAKGMYILKMTNTQNSTCVKKVIVY